MTNRNFFVRVILVEGIMCVQQLEFGFMFVGPWAPGGLKAWAAAGLLFYVCAPLGPWGFEGLGWAPGPLGV